MTFRSSLSAALTGLLVAACSSSGSSIGALQPQILIASDFPQVAGATDVPSMEDAIRLAVAENPRVRGYRLAYVPFDDSVGGEAWPQKGLQNLKSMFAVHSLLGLVGPLNSYMIVDEIPRASAENLVMLSPTATNVCLTVYPFCDDQIELAHKTFPTDFFRIAPPDPAQGRAMAHYAARLNIRSVAAINIWHAPDIGDGDPYMAEFRRELAFHGGELVLTQEVPRPYHDFTKFLVQAKHAGAEAIYAVGDVDHGICDIRAQMGSDFKYLFLTDGATGDPTCLKAPASIITFGTSGTVDATLSSDPAARRIVASFLEAYPHVNISDYTFAAYDCALILITAIGRAIDADRGAVPSRLDVLKQVAAGEFDGGATGNYKFLPNGDAMSPTMSMWGVKDNSWYYIDRVDASVSP